MKLSLKNMLISFVLSLVVFSLIMTGVCISIYRSRVGVREGEGDCSVSAVLPSRESRYDFSETVLYYDTDTDGNFRFAVVVGISENQGIITLTSIPDTLPINYKNSIYYASSICHPSSAEESIENNASSLVEALLGFAPDRTVSVTIFSHFSAGDIHEFCDQVRRIVQKDEYKDYTVKRVDIVLDENGVADNGKTMAQFFTVKTK